MRPESSSAAIEVYEPDGYRLIAVGCRAQDAPHAFTCSAGNGALLAYYFGKGKRDVVVRSGPNEGVTAHLGTRWERGHREWTLDW